MRPGVEEGKVADQGLQDRQRSSLRVLCQNLNFVPLCCFRRVAGGRTAPQDIKTAITNNFPIRISGNCVKLVISFIMNFVTIIVSKK